MYFNFYNNSKLIGTLVNTLSRVISQTSILIYRKFKDIENAFHVSIKLWCSQVEVWENEKSCGNMSHRRVFPQLFLVLPNFDECYHTFIETTQESFLFLL